MNTYRLIAVVGLSLASSSIYAGEISAASYSNDFTSSAADFTTTVTNAKGGTAMWTLDTSGSGYLGHDDDAAVSGNYTASIQHTLLGGVAASAKNFELDASVVYVGTNPSTGNSLGIGFLDSVSNLTGDAGYRLYTQGVGNDVTGSIFLKRNGVIVDFAGLAADAIRFHVGDTFNFHIDGTFIDAAGSDGINDALSLSITVTNVTDAKSFSLSYLDTDPLAGNYFGIRDDDVGDRQHSAQWDSFSLATIPEPSTYAALAGVLGLGFAAFRRRRI